MLERLLAKLTRDDEPDVDLDFEPENPDEVPHDDPWPQDEGDEHSAEAEQ